MTAVVQLVIPSSCFSLCIHIVTEWVVCGVCRRHETMSEVILEHMVEKNSLDLEVRGLEVD